MFQSERRLPRSLRHGYDGLESRSRSFLVYSRVSPTYDMGVVSHCLFSGFLSSSCPLNVLTLSRLDLGVAELQYDELG